MHRILIIALMCAALYGAVLGQHAYAQEEAESADGAAQLLDPTLKAVEPAPIVTLADGTGALPLSEPPVATPPAAPVAPAPEPSPSNAQPAPTAAPAPTPTEESAPARPAPGGDCIARRAPRATIGSERPSTSTSARRCADTDPASEDRAATRRGKKRKTKHDDHEQPAARRAPARRPDGSPSVKDPSYAGAALGAAPIGVPNFFIDKFRVPPFLLPIYQAAGIEYGIRWEVLAAINEIETDYGRNLNVSSAGALGWMQFMPATWKAYGVDANHDGRKDPYNPVDAIFAAARYLRASGGDSDLRKAVFAYNHADWYVDSVLLRARVLAGLPADLVGSLTGLTQARFPVHAKASYAGRLTSRGRRARAGGNAAFAVESQPARRGIQIYSRRGAPVIAVNDGRIVGMGRSARLGRWVRLRDVYGNTFTYADLGEIATHHPVLRPRRMTRTAIARELDLPRGDSRPDQPASTTRSAARRAGARRAAARANADAAVQPSPRLRASTERAGKERLFAHPARPNVVRTAAATRAEKPDFEPIVGATRFDPSDYDSRPLRKGARVVAGTVLGRLGDERAGRAPRLRFEIRPAGRGAPRIDPKPILDGWKLLESTAVYRAAGRNPFFGRDASQPSVGQILLMSKEALMRRVVRNPRIDIYGCGERDILSGQIDRRVLASLEFLAASGLRPTVSSLKCGHGFYTASGNVSHHSSGNAVDIAAVNGIPIMGHQGSGSITDITIQRLLTLQGTMEPDQIISLMKFAGTSNTFAMGDHADHIHVGWRPSYGEKQGAPGRASRAVLRPRQWIDLVTRLGEIENPHVRARPSRYAVKVVRRASSAHVGE